MSLRLFAPHPSRGPHWTIRGTYRGRHVYRSARVKTREEADAILHEFKTAIDAGDGVSWRKIPGFSRYEISDNGKVRRLPALLKQTPSKSGHLSVTIYDDNGKAWRAGVHHFVARAFLGDPPPGKNYACHKNGRPTHNTKENLYWGSPSDNAADAIRHASLVLDSCSTSGKEDDQIKKRFKIKRLQRLAERKNPLGKGEVVSSILPGSTTKAL